MLIAGFVDGVQNLFGVFRRLGQQGAGEVVGEVVIDATREPLLHAGGVVHREEDVVDRGAIGHEGSRCGA